jgi:hypothetical protein
MVKVAWAIQRIDLDAKRKSVFGRTQKELEEKEIKRS